MTDKQARQSTSIVSKLADVRELVQLAHKPLEEFVLGDGNEISEKDGCRAEYAAKQALTLLDELIEGQGDGWLPIESAPRDGARILTCSENGLIQENYVMQKRGYYKGMWGKSTATDQPTYWQPLPQPPKQLTEGDK